MSWYKNYEAEWRNIIAMASLTLGKDAAMIEKDVIQSMFLYRLSQSELPFVFKGGTCLSKAYQAIDRFSEDIDLSMSRNPTVSEKRKSKYEIIAIAEELGLTLANPESVRSKHDYNLFLFKYESFFMSKPQELKVETSYYQPVYPVCRHKVSSYIEKYEKESGRSLPIPFPEASFEMVVTTLDRTLVDKVFAVCDYRIKDMRERDSRHIYDIYKLFPLVKADDSLKDLVDQVRADRMKSKNNPSAQPDHDIPSMLKEIIESRFYEDDYNDITYRLLYEKVDYDDATKGIENIANIDIFTYRILK